MNANQRQTIRESVNKASGQLRLSRDMLDSYRSSDAIQAAQVCIELSVKAVFHLLDIPFQYKHGWTREQVGDVAKIVNGRDLVTRIKDSGYGRLVPLPRLILLMNFWAGFYLEAKYGFEAGLLASADALFEREDAQLAVSHANDCFDAAQAIDNLSDEQLGELVHTARKDR